MILGLTEMDNERRYYWMARWGLTEEDAAIIRARGIPTVDQERALTIETEVDARDALDRQALQRRFDKRRRK
jgi:hypothetical protein